MNARLQLLYDRVAETGCHCPGDDPREELSEHTCLAALAEQAGKALEAEAAKVVEFRRPPTARAAFAAGMRYAVDQVSCGLDDNVHEVAKSSVDELARALKDHVWAEVRGERFDWDDDSQNGGYYQAHPEHQRPKA